MRHRAGHEVAEQSRTAEDFASVVTELASIVLAESTLDTALEMVTSLARATIPGVSAVSISLRLPDRLETRRAVPQEAAELDGVQYETHQGPCVATIDSGQQHNVTLNEMYSRWPDFAAAAHGYGVGRIASVPLQVRGETIGALNLYASEAEDVILNGEESLAHVFAHHASVVLANAAAYAAAEAKVEQLMDALASRDVIGQAKGILMAREGCTSEKAFDILRQASQRTQRKLRDIAEEVVRSSERRLA